MKLSINICALVLVNIFTCTASQLVNFTNPILDTPSSNPCVLKHGQHYLLALPVNGGTELHMLKSEFLTSFRFAEKKLIYKAPVGYSGIEPTSLLHLHNQLYLYMTMVNATGIYTNFVLKADDPQDPMGRWGTPTRLLENIWTQWSYDGTVLKHDDKLYFVWTSKHTSINMYSIYIAEMDSPTVVFQSIVRIREPLEEWECQGECVNGSPYFIYNRGVSYMVFSASSTAHPNCSLSYMSVESGKDPMLISSWTSAAGPVFVGNEQEELYGACNAVFTNSPDGTETWMVYQGSSNLDSIPGTQVARIEKIGWDAEDGSPFFPEPHGHNSPQSRPSGEPEMFLNPIPGINSAYPEVIQWQGFYYLAPSSNSDTGIVLYRSKTLTDFGDADSAIIFRPPPGYTLRSIRRIHELDGEIYMYFRMLDETSIFRTYVIKADNASDPLGTWGPATRLLGDVWDEEAFYGTVLQLNNLLYFVWNSRIGAVNKFNLYIAEMSSPTEVIGPVVLLREPYEAWECGETQCVSQLPTFVYSEGVAFMVFTAGGTGNASCSLSYMSIEKGKNPLDVLNWKSALEPVFTGNDEEDVYEACHSSFTHSPDGTETWLFYQASDTEIVQNVSLRLENVKWSEKDGTPIFPKPHGRNHPQPVPSSI